MFGFRNSKLVTRFSGIFTSPWLGYTLKGTESPYKGDYDLNVMEAELRQ